MNKQISRSLSAPTFHKWLILDKDMRHTLDIARAVSNIKCTAREAKHDKSCDALNLKSDSPSSRQLKQPKAYRQSPRRSFSCCLSKRCPSFRAARVVFGHSDPGFSFGIEGSWLAIAVFSLVRG